MMVSKNAHKPGPSGCNRRLRDTTPPPKPPPESGPSGCCCEGTVCPPWFVISCNDTVHSNKRGRIMTRGQAMG